MKSSAEKEIALEEVPTDEPQSNQESDILPNNNKLPMKNAKKSYVISKNDFPEEVRWTDDPPQQNDNEIDNNKDKKQKDILPEEFPASEPPSFRDHDLDKKQASALGHQQTIDVFSRESQEEEEEEASSHRPVESQDVVVDGPGAYAIQGRETELLDSGFLTAHDQETNHQTSPPQPTTTTQQVAAEATADIEAFYRQNILQDTVQANVLRKDTSKDKTNTTLSRRFFLIVGVLVIVAIVIAVSVAVPLSNKRRRSRQTVVDSTSSSNGVDSLLPFGNATTTTTILPSLEPSMSPSFSILPSLLPSSSPSQQPFVPVTVAIFFDSRAGEVAWNLVCGNAVIRDVPQGTYSAINGDFDDTLIVETLQVENGSPCQFTILDRSGLSDGDGEGFYQIFLGERGTTSSILVGEGSDFDDEEQVLFIATPTGVPAWNQLGDTIDGDGRPGGFGTSVSLSGNGSILAVGATSGSGRGGRVRVYQFMEDSWMPLGQVLNDSLGGFGAAVALSSDGTILAVGGNGRSSSSVPSSVRVYRLGDDDGTNQTWSQLGQNITGQLPQDRDCCSTMAMSLSSDGSRLVFATPLNFFSSFSSSEGLVQAYQYDEQMANWTQIGQDIRGSNETEESFGFAAQLSGDGNVLAVGAPRNNPNEFVRVFRYEPELDEWVQMGQDITGSGGRFGSSVSLSFNGTILAVGAPRQGDSFFGVGGVRVFQYNDDGDGNWTQLGQDIEGEEDGDEVGASVSLSDDGTVLAVGATETFRNGAEAGRAGVYRYTNEGNWNRIGQPFRSGGVDEEFGGSVSLSSDGSIVAAGAPDGIVGGFVHIDMRRDADFGFVKVFETNLL